MWWLVVPWRLGWCTRHTVFYVARAEYDPEKRRDCYRCRMDRNRRDSERRKAVRQPPRPPHEATAGVCNLCADPVTGRRRTWCSDACVAVWNVATNSRAALWHLVELHGRVCWRCDRRWEPTAQVPWSDTIGPPSPRPVSLFVDHVRPLWSLTDDERLELRWWLPFNLQLLCGDCHGVKTRAEARERAAQRRAAA